MLLHIQNTIKFSLSKILLLFPSFLFKVASQIYMRHPTENTNHLYVRI